MIIIFTRNYKDSSEVPCTLHPGSHDLKFEKGVLVFYFVKVYEEG